MGTGTIKEFIFSCVQKFKNKKTCKFTVSSRLAGENRLEGNNFLDKRSALYGCSMGFASYIGHDTVLERTAVGRYTCIGPNVSIITGVHPSSRFVSVHPAFFSLKKQVGFTYVKKQLFEEEKYADRENGIYVTIGSDVWIGNGAKIMSGVHIGNGAIIAAGALVTKDVEPYTIVGGVPAQVIRRRFEQQEIDFLLQFRWWEKDREWIAEHAEWFDDISRFKSMLEKTDSGSEI